MKFTAYIRDLSIILLCLSLWLWLTLLFQGRELRITVNDHAYTFKVEWSK